MREKFYDKNLYFEFEDIDRDRVGHLFSSRIGWKDENEVLLKKFPNTKEIVSLKQVHGNKVEKVDREFISKYKSDTMIEGDGLITDLNNIILKTYHADCTPLYFIDYKKNVVGVAHAGWKGSYENMMASMIDRIESEYGSSLEDIHVYIGPAIKSCCYEFGELPFKKFVERYGKDEKCFIERNSRYYIDTQNINYKQAIERGIDSSKIVKTDLCTACNLDKLYSYRKENGTNGRLITAIVNKE